MAMADKIDTELLISLVETRPSIWDRSLDIHKDMIVRNGDWRDIARVLNPEFIKLTRQEKNDYVKVITRKWTNIRDAWKKSLGDHRRTARPYIYHEQIKFLLKNIKPNEIRNASLKGYVEEKYMEVHEESVNDEASRDSTEHHSDGSSVESYITNQSGKRKIKEEYDSTEEKEDSVLIPDSKRRSIANDDNSHHISFIKGLLPVLNKLNDEQCLEFQAAVINLLQNIRRRARSKTNIETITFIDRGC